MVNRTEDSSNEKQDEFLEKAFYEPINKIIESTKIPSLKPELEKIFYRKLKLEYSIHEAKDLDEINKEVIIKSENLEKQIQIFKDILTAESEVKKATFRKNHFSRKQEALKLHQELRKQEEDKRFEIEEEIDEILTEVDSSVIKFYESIDDFIELSEKATSNILKAKIYPLEKSIWKFKFRTFFFKIWRTLERFFVSVVVVGMFAGLAVSQTAKLFFETNWKWIFLLLLVWNISKEYKIGPAVRNWRFRKQKSDLIIFLNKVFETEVQFEIRKAFEEEKNKQLK